MVVFCIGKNYEPLKIKNTVRRVKKKRLRKKSKHLIINNMKYKDC